MTHNNQTMADPAVNAETLLTHLTQLIDLLQRASAIDPPDNNYASYLHGQIYGIALALRLLFPGPSNWGERAALLIRPVLTEHECDCQENPHN